MFSRSISSHNERKDTGRNKSLRSLRVLSPRPPRENLQIYPSPLFQTLYRRKTCLRGIHQFIKWNQ